MFKKKIFINEIKAVNKVCTEASLMPCEVFIQSGRYNVNAKSLLGIFSLDLSKEVEISIDAKNTIIADKFFEKISDFIV